MSMSLHEKVEMLLKGRFGDGDYTDIVDRIMFEVYEETERTMEARLIGMKTEEEMQWLKDYVISNARVTVGEYFAKEKERAERT